MKPEVRGLLYNFPVNFSITIQNFFKSHSATSLLDLSQRKIAENLTKAIFIASMQV